MLTDITTIITNCIRYIKCIITARKTSADYSDIQILQKAGFNIYGQGVLPERTRLNIVNNLFDKGLVYINPKCKNLIRGLETVQVNDYG